MRFIAPKYFTHNYIEDFLKSSEPIFDLNNKYVPNVIVDISRIREVSIIGLLLIYKFLDYTYLNLCFNRPKLNVDKTIEDAWKKYEFEALIARFISNKDITEQEYKKFKIKIENNFIIAPQPLLRNAEFSKESLKNDFIPNLSKYYENDEKTVLMLFTCLSEILLNFWEHAIDDNRSILIADGNKNSIEIACADTGKGIISSLRENDKYSNTKDLLSKALNIGVTSKENTNHMGYGLWIINQITTLTKGRLYIYSEGSCYKNEFGKIKQYSCPYWKGTIVYLNLPLKNPVTFSDLYEKLGNKEELNKLKINFE